ncbi:MAG: ChbG/HpnK family deacetylase [Bacillus sp. (in: Bacteria)]|nr:ChbG/HpnK family deacetylase [Bacillus sp. (in: firmicutes)]MCM1426151.1 ChbG/HpnK family deacetylase [Eubacterium sp.]
MPEIDVHADDYALTVHTSADILDCMKKGKLNSISIVPNMSCFAECMEMLYEAVKTLPFLPVMSVHLDFVEGRCLAGAKEVPLLASPDSDLTGLSWGKLFLFSYHPMKRKAVKIQLEKEIKAQIETGWQAISRCMEIAGKNHIACKQKGLRIDAHQHAHMIPVVWEALTEVIDREGYPVEYIRNSKEVLGAFLSEVSLWKTYRPINFVKNRILSFYSHKVDRYAAQHSMEKMYLWGLVMSGHMDYDRIVILYPKIAAKAQKENRTLEFCMHPGLALPEEITAEIGEDAAEDFYLQSDRQVEKDAVMRLTD